MYKLLIVDDEYDLCTGLSRFFPWETLGFTVAAFLGDGKQAYDYVCKTPVDIVLCDINMPVMNGLEFAKIVHENYPSVMVVFFSGYSKFEYAQEALEYNVKSYVLKSAKYNELIRTFTRLREELDVLHSSGEEEKTEGDFDEKVLSRIIEYIKHNYATVTLEDLTSVVYMNPNYISRYFKLKTGRNFSDYVMEVRMKKAAELLDDLRYKTYEVSALVGYSNAVNFTRTFKNYYGMSPREYRNRKQGRVKNETAVPSQKHDSFYASYDNSTGDF